MYIVTCVYNTLNKVVRRIREKMKPLENQMSGAYLVIPIGFSLLVAGLALNINLYGRSLFLIAGTIGVIGGIYWLNQIYKRLKDKEGKQEERKEQRYEELITELKGIREDLNKR